ncbi:MAG: hypothetical protein JXB17_13840 [Bacteroidales bacterium]|nr:hypothetical protein [Bacteroidales bacterium]
MKKKCFKLIGIFALLAIVLTFVINSCSKDDTHEFNDGAVKSEILRFESIEEYNNTMNKVLLFNYDQLKAWEKSKGFKSFGRTCDELYSNINPENFKSVEEVKTFVASNNEYLQLIEDVGGELTLETILYKSPNRYFINKDKMFQINETVYKIFDKGIASTKIDKINKLRTIDENSLLSYNNDPDIRLMNVNGGSSSTRLKDAAYNCGTNDDDYESSGNDRTHMWIECYEMDIWDEPNQIIAGTTVSTYFLIRPYKRILGIWYWCKRTISADIKTRLDYYVFGNWYNDLCTYHENGKKDSKLEGLITFWASTFYWVDTYVHFGGYDCWADTPSSPLVNLECNKSLF